jgi:hypothetical protein
VVAAYNFEYRQQFFIEAGGQIADRIRVIHLRRAPRVPIGEAVSLVNRDCGQGGATILGVGIVKVGLAGGPQWAVSYDPPGPHLLVRAAADDRAAQNDANWYLGFVATGRANRPFCTGGHFAALPRLPVHGP